MAGFLPIFGVPRQEAVMTPKSVRFLAMIIVLGACARGAPGTPAGPDGDKVIFTGDQKSDWAQIGALENEAKALVKTDGCSSTGECRTAPVGSKACGGPRYYLVYCSRTTDSAALFKKLDAIAAAEREFNSRYQIVSTCEFRTPPMVALSGGSCQAQ
jgi:hypothetical protein